MLIAGRQIAWCVMAGCPDADLRKLQYALDKYAEEYQFDETVPLDPAVDEAIKWQAARTPTEVIQQREEMMQKLEEANAALWKSGKCANWFERCDNITRGVGKGVNGYLLQELLSASQHCDVAAADLFRDGKCLTFALFAGSTVFVGM